MKMTSSKKRKGFCFTFYGGVNQGNEVPLSFSAKSLTLADGAVGDRLKIIQPQTNFKKKQKKQFSNYLQSLGLKSGKKLTVISRTASGSVIVADDHNTIGLSADISQKIEIVKVDSNTSTNRLNSFAKLGQS